MALRNAIASARSKFVIEHNEGLARVLITREAAKLDQVINTVEQDFPDIIDNLKEEMLAGYQELLLSHY